MDRESLIKSRRAFLRASAVWAATAGLHALIAGEDKDRALLCAYAMIGGSDAELANAEGINPALGEVRDLYSAGIAAIVNKVSAPAGWGPSPDSRYGALRFLPAGSFTPQWASPDSSSVATLPSGLTVASRVAVDSGLLSLAAAAASFRTEFPDTGIGRQLRDAAAVLRLRKSFDLSYPVLTSIISGFRPGEPVANNRILADLSRALGAFHQAMLELDISKQVTAYTDMDFGSRSAEGRAQIVMGGSVRGGRVYGAGTLATPYEVYTAELLRWPSTALTASFHKSMGFLD
jgi:hypothetical protein